MDASRRRARHVGYIPVRSVGTEPFGIDPRIPEIRSEVFLQPQCLIAHYVDPDRLGGTDVVADEIRDLVRLQRLLQPCLGKLDS